MNPLLPKSYKKRFPFKICTTSFIYPDDYVPNVKMLSPYLDEVELLFFESRYLQSLPTGRTIDELFALSESMDVSYNIHLPTDISVADPDRDNQRKAVEIISRIIKLCSPLSPSTHTLHLPCDFERTAKKDVEEWQERVYTGMEMLLETGVAGRSISIETLSYPFEWLDPIFEVFPLSVCIDLGHLMVQQINCREVFNRYKAKTSAIHLHGVENKTDHLSLDKLSHGEMNLVMEILRDYSGVVSLEVFSFENLSRSLAAFEAHWEMTAPL